MSLVEIDEVLVIQIEDITFGGYPGKQMQFILQSTTEPVLSLFVISLLPLVYQ